MKKITYLLATVSLLSLTGIIRAQTISTVAGNGTSGYSGDGGQATDAELNFPVSMAIDNAGNIYIADNSNDVIRKIDVNTGIMSTYAGIASGYGYSGDGGQATDAELSGPWGIAIDNNNNLYIADDGNNVIRKVDNTGIITTIAGNNISGYSGDGAQATDAEIACPTGVGVDKNGQIYIADECNNVIRVVLPGPGLISTLAGNGSFGYSGDGAPATAAELNSPVGVTVDKTVTNIFIADGGNAAIKRDVNTISTNISTVAGNGTTGYSGGDGGPATAAEIANSSGQACGLGFDSAGNVNLFIPDLNNKDVVRQFNTVTGIITTCAGNGTSGYTGDGGPATAAELSYPQGSALDATGNLFIADANNNVIREVSGSPLFAKKVSRLVTTIEVYPNPAKSNLFVNLINIKGKTTLELYNELGSRVMNETIEGNQILNLPVNGFASGIYLLKLTPANGQPITKKVNIIN